MAVQWHDQEWLRYRAGLQSIEAAEINGLEAWAWLRHVLEQVSYASSVADYEALLPWGCSSEMRR